jgi:signal transduction histidine kinase
MISTRRSTAQRYGFAIVVVVLCTALRVVADPYLGASVPFIFYFAAVALAAWFGGLATALLAAVLSAMAAGYAFIIPHLAGGSNNPSLWVQLSVFLLVSFVISRLIAPIQQSRSRIAATEGRERAGQQADKADRLKDEFLAIVCHELRSPLNTISGWAQVLRRTTEPATVEHGLNVIGESVLVQARMIGDIQDAAAMVGGRFRLRIAPVDLAAVLAAALDSVRPTAEAKNVTLHSGVDSVVGMTMGDADRLQQAVVKLLSNAIKFSPKESRVLLCIQAEPAQIRITVQDSSAAKAAEYLPDLFTGFGQGNHSSPRFRGGSGLNLAMVRHIIELHGGTISIRRDGENAGATFTVRLPVTAEELAQPFNAADSQQATVS